MVSPVHYSSAKEDWETPDELFIPLHREFSFGLDVCANATNAKLPRYYGLAENGLERPWEGSCWCNPPYGRPIGQWTRRAVEMERQASTVLLVPARVDTSWWLHLIGHASEARFLVGAIDLQGCPFRSSFSKRFGGCQRFQKSA